MRQTALHDAATFQEAIEPFIRPCPGPELAVRGLRLVAYQRVSGIPGLSPKAVGSRLAVPSQTSAARGNGGGKGYIASVAEVARRLNCRPGYLCQSASRLGYSYSRALRWLRFCHGIALRAAGEPSLESAWRTGFSDPSGWTRFTRALIGKSPRQLPRLPLEDWVWLAMQDTYFNRLVVTGECGDHDKGEV